MKNKITILCACLILECFTSKLPAISLNQNAQSQTEPARILINNRILARVNDKTISTYDVARKMDMLFFHQFPEYLTIIEARHQFYLVNWKSVLEELINKELILADAQEHKVEVSSGDVRQEIESLFGPNVHENLDKAGMSFDEAAKMVQGDLIFKRMVNARVSGKALRAITPNKVRQSYDIYIQNPKNASKTKWNYRVVTIKDRNLEKTQETADKAYRLLIENNVPLDQLIPVMKEKKLLGKKSKVTISSNILNSDDELSPSYKEILSGMEVGMISQPSMQKSRANQATVYRIFQLNEKIPGGVPAFKEIENKLKERLLNDYYDQESISYLEKLRHHYHVREQDLGEMFPSNYQPFILK